MNEFPMISMSVFYYDTAYQRSTAKRVLEILEQNQMFFPERMRADHLTRGRMKKYVSEMRNLFLDGYAEPDVLGIEWEAGDPASGEGYIGFQWCLTFLKQRQHIPSSYQPWNVLTFNFCYDWLTNSEQHARLVQCTKDLSLTLNAFCSCIDDISHKLTLRHQTGAHTFSPKHIQQVYWGNYWGEHLLSQVQLNQLRALHLPNYSETDRGVFFTLTDNVFDFNSRACNTQRRNVAKAIRKERCK